MRILIVEHDAESLQFMTDIFTSLKIDVRSLPESLQAAILVNHEHFDAIFVAIETPNLNGFALAQVVRQSSFNKSTPIVMITGSSERDKMYQSFALGATFFLRKPLDELEVPRLLRMVDGCLHDDRHGCIRVPMYTQVSCDVGARKLRGSTWNLSQGGMQLEVGNLEAGETVHLSFTLPNPPLGVDASGMVAWVKDDRQGIRFTEMTLQHQETVRDFIARSG